MPEATWLPNGDILAPVAVHQTVQGEEFVGDGMATFRRGTPEWKKWRPHVQGKPPPNVATEREA